MHEHAKGTKTKESKAYSKAHKPLKVYIINKMCTCIQKIYFLLVSIVYIFYLTAPSVIPISRNQAPNGTPIIGKPEDASQ